MKTNKNEGLQEVTLNKDKRDRAYEIESTPLTKYPHFSVSALMLCRNGLEGALLVKYLPTEGINGR